MLRTNLRIVPFAYSDKIILQIFCQAISLFIVICNYNYIPLITVTDCIFAWYDSNQSDDEALVLKLWGLWSTPSLLQGLLWPRVVAPERVLSMVQIELFDI